VAACQHLVIFGGASTNARVVFAERLTGGTTTLKRLLPQRRPPEVHHVRAVP
jgi:hypothetical protein